MKNAKFYKRSYYGSCLNCNGKSDGHLSYRNGDEIRICSSCAKSLIKTIRTAKQPSQPIPEPSLNRNLSNYTENLVQTTIPSDKTIPGGLLG
jgi:hypothetical protein